MTKIKKRSLLLQSLEERILWDATLQPTPPDESSAQEQQVVAESTAPETQVNGTESTSQTPPEDNANDVPQSAEAESLLGESSAQIAVDGNLQEMNASATGSESETSVEIVVVDGSVENKEALIQDILDQNAADSSKTITIVEIGSHQSGIDQVTDVLRQSGQSVDAVHVVGHGDQDQIFLGADRLSNENLNEQRDSLANWAQYLSESADILFYGCDVVENEHGAQLLTDIADITGADVSGSTDTTGSEKLGGDWDLEFNVGSIETDVLLAQSAGANWSGVLALDAPIGGIDAPTAVMIDEDPNFTLCFDSPAGSDPGFGPFGDLVTGEELDITGITYLGAPVSFTEVGTWDGTNWRDSSNNIIANHPFDATAAVGAGNLAIPTAANTGDTWFAIELPFGSYTESQPKIGLDVAAEFNSNAEVGAPIDVSWTPGYLLGSTADGSANDAVQGTTSSASITPEVIQIEKRNDLSEQETVTGPNYPVEYTITINVADGETVDNVIVTDYLPANSVFLGDGTDITNVTVTPINGGTSTSTAANYNSGTNTLSVNLGSVDGAIVGAGEIEITYYVYFQDIVVDGAGTPNTNNVPALNESTVAGVHNGVAVTDSGDSDAGGAADGTIDDGDVQVDVQNLSTQKTPQLVTGFNADGSPILAPFEGGAVVPGALIYWTVDVQVSDYHAFDNLAFTDQLSDGQEFIDGSSSFTLSNGTVVSAADLTPTLFVANDSDFGGNTDDSTATAIDFDAAHVYTAGETPPATLSLADGSLTNPPGASATGEVTTIFDISGQLRANGSDGVLVGDLNNTNDLSGDTDDSTLPGDITVPRLGANATTLTLTFFSSIREEFTDVTGDAALNSGDPIGNDGEIEGDVGDVADNGDFTADPLVTGPLIDDTSFSIEVSGVSIDKSIYAINQVEVQNPDFFDGSANPDEDDNESDEAIIAGIQPGDEVTYRIRVELSSVNAENFKVTDFLPLPVYDVDFDFTPDQFTNNPGDAPVTADLTSGNVQFGEDYNLHNTGLTINVLPTGADPSLSVGDSHPTDDTYPQVSFDAGNNQLIFDFGTFNEQDAAGASTSGEVIIDLLITATVLDNPISDSTAITNQAQVSETDSSGNPIATEDIVQIQYLAPDLAIQKGVVAIDSGSAGSLTAAGPNFGVNFANTDPGVGTPATDSLDFAGNTITLAAFQANNGILDSDVEDVDGGDHVRYAITVYNEGQGDAHDILVQDQLPDIASGFIIPGNTVSTATAVNDLNLQIYDGLGNRLTAGTDFTVEIVGGELFVEISRELDGRTNDDMGNEVADSDEILTDANPGNGNAAEVLNAQDGDEIFIIVYDLELDNEAALDSTGSAPDTTYTNTAQITEFYQTAEGDPLRNPDNNLATATDSAGNLIQDDLSAEAEVTTPDIEIEKNIISTDLTTAGNNNLTQATVGERITYEVRIKIPEGEVLNARLIDNLERGLELSSIDSVRFVDGSNNPITTIQTTGVAGFAEYTGPSASGELLAMPITAEVGPLDYTRVDNGPSQIDLQLGTLLNTNDDASIDEFVVLTYTVMVVNDTSVRADRARDNEASLSWDVDNGAGGTNTVTSDVATDRIRIVEPELEVVKTVEVAGVPSTGNANDEVNPDSATGDIGDTVTYTIVIQHTGDSDTDAYDVTFTDQIPTEITSVNLVSAIYSEGATSDLAGTDIVLAGNNITTANDFTVAFGETVTVTVTGVIGNSVNVGDVVDNTGEITYTSYPETPDQTNFVPGTDDSERGPDGSPGERDGYNDSDPARIEITANSIEKYIVNSELTNETPDATADGQLATIDDADGVNRGLEATIGETLTYEIVVTVSEGITNNAVLQDMLDPGLVLVSLDSIETRQFNTDTNTIIAGPTPNFVIENQATLFGGVPATDASNAFVSYAHVAGENSDTLALTLGDITNTNDNNNIDEQIVLRYTVMVSDIVTNAGNDAGTLGTQRNNSAELTYTDAAGMNPQSSGTDSADNIEIVEPDLEVVKDVVIDGPGDAGDEVTYTITIQHTGDSESDAFDVSLADTLPTDIDFSGVNFGTGANIVITDSNSVLGSGDFEISAGSLQFAATPNTQVDEAGNNTVDFQLGVTPRVVTIEITGVLLGQVQPGDLIENDANIQYSSLDQHDDGSVNPVGDGDDEEDRSNFVPGAAEDSQRIYTDTDDADFTVPAPTIDKELTGSDVTTTGNAANQATIGELVTYTITVGVPEGDIDNVSILDTIDPGLEFFDVVSVSGTLNGSNVVTDLAGGFASVNASGIMGDATSGQRLTFNLGNLTTAGDNTGVGATSVSQGDDFIVIEYRAVVKDIAANVDGRSGINNSAELSYETDATVGLQTLAPVAADPISLVEPRLEVIKQINGLADEVDATNLDAGDTVTYLITIQHTDASSMTPSSTTAFDTFLNDVLPTEIDFSSVNFGAGTDVVVTDTAGSLTTADFAINAGALQFDVGGMSPTTQDIEFGRVITVQITGTITNASAPNSTITNQADINWSSLPEGHTNNGMGDERGEQVFDGEGMGANPYDNSDDIAYTTPLPVFEKSVLNPATSSIHGTGADGDIDLTIGEEVTYELVAILNEGTTPVLITDNLPNNATGELQLVSAEVSFIGAGVTSNSNGLVVGDDLSSAFITSPNVNQAVFNFGNVVVDGNNVTAGEDNIIKVQVTAVVVNTASMGANEDGDQLTNTANLNFSATPAMPDPSEVLTDTVDVDIIEPELGITKEFVDPITGAPVSVVQPGDTVRVRLTVENTGTANAYDVEVGDLINDQDLVFINPVVATTPAGFTFNFTDGGGGAGTPDATDNVTFSANAGVFIPPVSSAPANELVFEFDVELTDAIVGADVFEELRMDNTATVEGDTLDGDPLLSNGMPNNEQRDTTDDDSDSIVGLPDFEKTVLSSNVTDPTNGLTDVTIGERVTYQIEFVVPDSDFDGDGISEAIALSVTDNLPGILELKDARVFSIGADITAPGLSAGDSLVGGAAGITGSDSNTVDGFDDRVVLNFGNVIVDDDDNNTDSDQTIIIEIEAIVKDDPANIGEDPLDPADDAINDKVNVASMTFGPITQSDSATVEVIEPELTIEKNFVDPTTGQPIFSGQAGDIVQIELTIENTGTAVAYDVFVEDALNAGVLANQYVDGSAVVVVNGGFTDVSMLGAGQNLVRLESDAFAAGATATFRINVELSGTLALASGDAIDNTATVEGESLDVDTLVDPSDAADSRTTSDQDQDFIFGIPSIEKEVADNYSNTGDADLLATTHVGTSSATGDATLEDLTIGEIVTYEVTIVLPDTFNAGQIDLVPTSITDQLPAGLGLVDARVVAIGGNLTVGESDGGEIVTSASSAALLDAGGGPGGAVLATNGSSTNLAIGDSLLTSSSNIAGTVGGSTVTFDFGGLGTNTVVVDENGDGTFERENTGSFMDLVGVEQSIVVQIDAVVLDSAATSGSITNPFTNQATLTYVQSTASPIVISDTADVEVVEPDVEIEKSFKDPVSGVDLYTINPGQQVLVELSVTNTGLANAYDVVVNDEVDLTYWQNITPQTTPGGFIFSVEDGVNATPMDTVTYTMDSISGAGITDPDNFIAPAETVVLTFLMEYNGDGGAGFELINTAEVEGDALPESLVPDPQLPGGGSAGLDVDRTTDDQDSDEVYESPSLDKEFTAGLIPKTGTSQFDPTIPDVAIGEVVVYDLTVTLPESPVDDLGVVIPIQVNLIDDLPDGFGLVGVEVTDIGSAITSPTLIVGDSIEILDPNTLAPIVDPNANITTADNFADPDMTQDQVTLNFGTVTVDPNSNNVANQTITVQVTAVVLDISPENDIGEIKTNEATLEFFGTPTGNPAMPFDSTTPIEITDSVDVEITPIPEDPVETVAVLPASVSLKPAPAAETELTIFDIYSYDVFDKNQEDFDELMLRIRMDIDNEIKKLPVSYMATGIAEHGSNVTMLVYSESGSVIGYKSVLADAAGNWVMTFPNLILNETPHHVEVHVTPVSYNDSTQGEYNTRVYYTPALDSRHFHSKTIDFSDVLSEQPETIMESQHQGNMNPLGEYDDDWNHPHEFLAISNNEKI